MAELQFFMGQAVAITTEDVVIAIAKQLGHHPRGLAARALGYLWVAAWLGYSTRVWFNGFTQAGMFVQNSSPTNIVGKGLELWRTRVGGLQLPGT